MGKYVSGIELTKLGFIIIVLLIMPFVVISSSHLYDEANAVSMPEKYQDVIYPCIYSLRMVSSIDKFGNTQGNYVFLIKNKNGDIIKNNNEIYSREFISVNSTELRLSTDKTLKHPVCYREYHIIKKTPTKWGEFWGYGEQDYKKHDGYVLLVPENLFYELTNIEKEG